MKRRCLDRAEIERVLSGQLLPDDFDSAIAHLDDCDQCRSVAESVQQDGHWLVDSLAGDADPLQLETACQVALWQVMETPAFTLPGDAVGTVPQEMLGPYRLIRSLGSGGMAAVYLAEHVRLRRQCAIKILPRDRVDQPGWLERFDREMTTVASLEHPHVVRATDAGHEDGWHYLVMEYLDGLDVGRIASRIGQLEVAEACEIVRQAALGLAHIHASGLVHRDIKPSNMMLTQDGSIKLLDLGLVLSGDDPLSVDDRLTTVGHLMGTMPYMAPEQLIDSREVDARADIYALGATLYRLIAGKPPHHRHGGLAKQVMAITNQDAPPLDAVRDDLDEELVSLVASMTSRDPAQRPQTAEEVAQRLSEMGDGGQLKGLLRQALRRPSSETPAVSSFLRPLQPFDKDGNRRSRRWLLMGTAMAAILLLAGFIVKIATDRGVLVIQGDKDVVIAVSQGEKVVERLKIKAGGDNRFTLHKGTYKIEIEGAAGGLSLTQNIVTIGRGTETPVELKPLSAMRLYQGKDLATWMDLLSREEDPNELGQIMNAVEVLTRDTDVRTKAAGSTLRTARIWGGFSSSSPTPNEKGFVSQEPSQHYMHHLREVFPRYASDGLEAIDTELHQGNVKSRLAAIWLLSELALGDTEMPENLLEHLKNAVADIDAVGGYYEKQAVELAKSIAVRLLAKQGRPVAGQSWLEDYVELRVAEAEASWETNPRAQFLNFGGGGFGPQIKNWVLDEHLLAAAMELEAAGRLEINWTFAASVLLHQRYQRVTDRTDVVFDAVAANAPSDLLDVITWQLSEMIAPAPISGGGGFSVGGFDGYATNSQGKFWNGMWIPLFNLGSRNSVWPKALGFFADHADKDKESIALIQNVREAMIRGGVNANHAAQPLQWIDAAIEKLQQGPKTKPTAPSATRGGSKESAGVRQGL